ncbi:hypothetical protein SARC_01076 [Sphaeroforma arctica JP610]|uniref:HSF-type DNA-binding domain-containing protein n=1 Tax=Sphaeroforma arctica JP610 TaxID=667725 RepID=A0A0L0GET4_9EUKA|nr:hypothetical protein SARC_01076 [Sphaeroforma arctica JP610]KNC86783.1 hypothetical protein SARC_01076 [Sphaeroforma arctica JP610]|eukprot:XP_014160685.1 hypothetical protein SARC_01076 [Sphaeroforma arctica JP610]
MGATGTLAADGKSAKALAQPTPFLRKLYHMVDDANSNNCIGWNDQGDGFNLVNAESFAKDILPHYFKHNNFATFVRQLNMYDFSKVMAPQKGIVQPGEFHAWRFTHPSFRRGHPELLVNIHRKTHSTTANKVKVESSVDVDELAKQFQQIRTENEQMKKEVAQLKQETSDLRSQNQALMSSSIMSISKSHEVHSSIEKILKFLASVYSHDFIRQQLESQPNQSNTIMQMFQTATQQHGTYTQAQAHAHNNSNVTAYDEDTPLFGMSNSLVPFAIESAPNDVEMSIEGDGNDRFISADSTPAVQPRSTTSHRLRTSTQPEVHMLSNTSSLSDTNSIDGDRIGMSSGTGMKQANQTRKSAGLKAKASPSTKGKKITRQKSNTAANTDTSSLTADRNNQLVLAYSHPHLDLIRQTQQHLQQQQMEIDRQRIQLQLSMQQSASNQQKPFAAGQGKGGTHAMGDLYTKQDSGLNRLSNDLDIIYAQTDTFNRNSAGGLAAVNSSLGANAPGSVGNDPVMYSVSSPPEDNTATADRNSIGVQRLNSGNDVSERRSSTMSMGVNEAPESTNSLGIGGNQSVAAGGLNKDTSTLDRSGSTLSGGLGGNGLGMGMATPQWQTAPNANTDNLMNTNVNTNFGKQPQGVQLTQQQQMQRQYLRNMQQQQQLQQMKAQQQTQQLRQPQSQQTLQTLQAQQKIQQQQQLQLLQQQQQHNQHLLQQARQGDAKTQGNEAAYGTSMLPQNEQTQAARPTSAHYSGVQPVVTTPPQLNETGLAQLAAGGKDGEFIYSPLPPLMGDGDAQMNPLLSQIDGNGGLDMGSNIDSTFDMDEYENMFNMADSIDLSSIPDLTGATTQQQLATLNPNANPNMINNTSTNPYAGSDGLLSSSPSTIYSTNGNTNNNINPHTDALTRTSTGSSVDMRTFSVPSLNTPLELGQTNASISPAAGTGLNVDNAGHIPIPRARAGSVKSPRLSLHSIRSPTAEALEMESDTKSDDDDDLEGMSHQRKRKRGVQ